MKRTALPVQALLTYALGLFAPLFFSVGTLRAEESATPERTAARKWFAEARFGMFIHWGPYAVPAGVWKGRPLPQRQGGEWILKLEKIPIAEYRALASGFIADQYDPKAWAALAKATGMKYVVITAKHHDGFALYDSAVTDWDVMSSGAKRDLLEPLAAAVRAEGLKFGCYYSQSQDWVHPGGERYNHDKPWDDAQAGDYDQYLQGIALPQVREILTRYRPDIIWWDTPVAMDRERTKPFADLLAKEAPGIISNNRLGQGFAGDTMTPEQHIPPRGYPGKMFEVCMTMNDTWGYKSTDTNWKSVRQLLRNLSDISSKGGNFLLNVGPDASGRIPEPSIERLQAVGQWMEINGEAIYSTQAGPFPRRLPWGRVTQKLGANGATRLYLHVWEWPKDGNLLLPGLAELPSSGTGLQSEAKVTAKASDAGLLVHLPGSAPDENISIVVLDFPGAITVTQPAFVPAAADGSVTFIAEDADLRGDAAGSIQVQGTGPEGFLTNWVNPAWFLEYETKTEAPGKWTIEAEVAAPESTQITLNVNRTATPAEIQATGPGLTWKTVTLGTIDLPKGECFFQIKPVSAGWKPVNIRKVRIIPAS